MILSYMPDVSYGAELEIEDIGNVAIHGSSAETCMDYYMVIQTARGKTSIIKFGGVLAALDLLAPDYSLEHKRMDYKERKIEIEISKYFTDYRKKIDLIELIDMDEALDNIVEIPRDFVEHCFDEH